jgi:hypothetical protein
MDWIDLALEGDKWRDLVNAIMNIRVPYNADNLQLLTIHIKIVCMACELLLWHVTLSMYWTCGIKMNVDRQLSV